MWTGPICALFLPALLGLDGELEEWTSKLREGDKWARIAAVKGLGRIAPAEPEAWGLVLGALADPDGEVGDTAQWVLGATADPEVVDALLRFDGLGARDPGVRLRAAEALGRVRAPVDGDLLARGLKVREPETRRAVLRAVERLAARGGFDGEDGAPGGRLVRAVEHAAKDRDARVQGKAVQAMVALDPERGAEFAARALRDRDAAPVCAVLARADELGLGDAVLAGSAADERVPVRTAAADALARRGTRAACRVLVERLEAEGEMRLAWRLVDHLQRLSGMRYRLDPRPWRLWVEGLPEGWRASRAALGGAGEDAPAGRSSALAGLPILSARLCFLIDLSGSMWKGRAGDKTRKEVVDERLRACLEGLPETTEFNLIPYTGEALPWRDGIVPAKPRDVAEAAAWFEARDERGSGDFWEAFQLALSDERVDTIVMLGDGEPTGGLRYVLELLPDLIDEENLGRQVAVDSILVDVKGKTRRTWQEIARRTGGRCVTLELD